MMTKRRISAAIIAVSFLVLFNWLYLLPNLVDDIIRADFDAAAALTGALSACFLVLASIYLVKTTVFNIIMTVGLAICNGLFLLMVILDSWNLHTIEEIIVFFIIANILFGAVYTVKKTTDIHRKQKSEDKNEPPKHPSRDDT
ncbi:MAG TPA: hypothetical protein ENN69_03095 [Spirochaetia bacterium]|nr:hypothetical protein [Spirochaetia bacterium]